MTEGMEEQRASVYPSQAAGRARLPDQAELNPKRQHTGNDSTVVISKPSEAIVIIISDSSKRVVAWDAEAPTSSPLLWSAQMISGTAVGHVLDRQ
jgi:hypothetical protein